MKIHTRDDTLHGVDYVRADDARNAVLAERARCVEACRAIESKLRASYKRAPNQYIEGMCDGAGECADAIGGVA